MGPDPHPETQRTKSTCGQILYSCNTAGFPISTVGTLGADNFFVAGDVGLPGH